MPTPNVTPSINRESILEKAVIRAAKSLGLTQADVAKTLGISKASVSRMRTRRYKFKEGSKEWELARLLVRVYLGLDVIMAGDEAALQAWMKNYNTTLLGVPAQLITEDAGLARTLDHIDAYRSRV